MKLKKPSEFHPVFPFSWAPPLLLHIIFIAPNCRTTIISLEPCALNAGVFSISYFADTTESGYRGVKGGTKTRGWRQGYFTDITLLYKKIFLKLHNFTYIRFIKSRPHVIFIYRYVKCFQFQSNIFSTSNSFIAIIFFSISNSFLKKMEKINCKERNHTVW